MISHHCTLVSARHADPDTAADVRQFLEPITETFKRVIGRSHVFLDGTRASCRLNECNLGEFRRAHRVTLCVCVCGGGDAGAQASAS